MEESIVLVTELEYGKAREIFEGARAEGWVCLPAPADEAGLTEAVRTHRASHVIVGVEPYRDALYEALPRGGVIARFGVGHDGVDKARASARGLYCTNTPGALDQSVAEFTMALLLGAARHIPKTAAACADNRWAPAVGVEAMGKTLAIIGFGPIGRTVSRMASFAFRMQVVVCEIQPLDESLAQEKFGVHRITPDWGEAVNDADFVSLHIPSIPATRHFVDAGKLAVMAPHAWLINTARGAVLDEAALYDALSSGNLGGAALDVFEAEPYEPAAPGKNLRALPNVVMTPHCGSSTVEACHQMARQCLRNLAFAREGQIRNMNLLNK